MVGTLRTHQKEEIDRLDDIIERLGDHDGVEQLKALRTEMQARLEP
jgi:hypothetical protein